MNYVWQGGVAEKDKKEKPLKFISAAFINMIIQADVC